MFRSIEQVLGKKDGGYLLYPGKSAKYSDASKVLNYHGFLSEYS